MNTKVAKAMLEVIRREQTRRQSRLPDDPDAAYDQCLFFDQPFLDDLCLLLLVAVRHQVERELVTLAARMTGDERPLSPDQYRERVKGERELLRNGGKNGGWKGLNAKLNLRAFPEWDTSMKTLRLIANSNKHETSGRPDDDLIRHLGLDLKRNYAPLAESGCVREGLAESLELAKDADYCAIAEEFLKRVESFLAAVKRQPGLSNVTIGAVSFLPEDAEC